jgi:hypothetical protein
MRFSIGVTTQARLAQQSRLIAVAGVTTLTGLMLRDLMESEQLRGRMAGGARGRLRRTWCGRMRLMAIRAAARDGAVLRRAFAHVAARARQRSGD